MKPVDFKQSNAVYAKDQEEYLNLPVHKSHNNVQGEVTSCWQMGLIERLRVLFTGKVFVSLWTFNHPLQPQKLATSFSELHSDEETEQDA